MQSRVHLPLVSQYISFRSGGPLPLVAARLQAETKCQQAVAEVREDRLLTRAAQ